MANSDRFVKLQDGSVVNCFQISNFVLWQTAAPESVEAASVL